MPKEPDHVIESRVLDAVSLIVNARAQLAMIDHQLGSAMNISLLGVETRLMNNTPSIVAEAGTRVDEDGAHSLLKQYHLINAAAHSAYSGSEVEKRWLLASAAEERNANRRATEIADPNWLHSKRP